MYEYITSDNLEEPQMYMYTKYEGEPFLRAYRESRDAFLRVHDMEQSVSFEELLQGLKSVLAPGENRH